MCERRRNVVSRMGDASSMNNLADLCRECELRQRIKELEEENRALKEALKLASNRLHQWSPGYANYGS